MNGRQRLPNKRKSQTTTLEREGSRYQMTVGYFPDGRVGEIFLNHDCSDSLLDVLTSGISIKVTRLPDLLKAITKAVKEARDRGLIDAEDGEGDE
jgi:hypothetical protein